MENKLEGGTNNETEDGSGFPNPVHITPIDLGTRKMDSFWVDVVVPIYCFSGDLVCCDQAVIFFFLSLISFMQ